MPWSAPADLRRFRDITAHHAVLMGRGTFASIGSPLRTRRNIILSRTLPSIPRTHPDADGTTIEIHSTLEAAMEAAAAEEVLYIIGGESVFRQTAERADELLLTRVEDDSEGDTVFPMDDAEVERSFVLTAEEAGKGMTFTSYRRRSGG